MTNDSAKKHPRFKWTPKRVFFRLYDNILGRSGRCFVLRTLPKHSVGCELGVSRGNFSKYMLSLVKPARLLLIDPWAYQPELAYEPYGGGYTCQKDMDAMYRSVCERFAGHPEAHIIRKKTAELTDEIADEELDWVYIDGCHEYEVVSADLRYFLVKVKPGGMICGDDYTWDSVARAVEEFLQEQANCQLLYVRKSQFMIKKMPSH